MTVVVREDRRVKEMRICDLGCGVGWLANEMRVFGEVTGVDFSPEGVRAASARWPGLSFMVGDVTKYRPQEPFNLVVCSDVIEHIEDQRAFIENIAGMLTEVDTSF